MILISNGILKRGDYFICGDTWGKIRAMINYEGKTVNEALPSTPIEILGMNDSAYAGAEFMVTKDEDEAKSMAEFKKSKASKNNLLVKDKTTLFDEVKNKEVKLRNLKTGDETLIKIEDLTNEINKII